MQRHIKPLRLSIFVLLGGLGVACTGPTPPPPPPGSDSLIHISGVVTNEDGAPVVNASVTINHCCRAEATTQTTARTDGLGRYETDVIAKPIGGRPSGLGLGFAETDTNEYEQNLQNFSSEFRNVVRDFQLDRVVRLAAGGSTTIVARPTSSLCGADIDEAGTIDNSSVCRFVHVTAAADGALTVETRQMNGTSSPAKVVVVDYAVWPIGSPAVCAQVKAGIPAKVALVVPSSSTPGSYSVTTPFVAGGRCEAP